MGAIAEGMVAYAQPLLDQTDGSPEQLEKAFSISTLCFNLALLPEDDRDLTISRMQASLKMDDEEFETFRSSIIEPMIRRHEDLFPLMHQRFSDAPSRSGSFFPSDFSFPPEPRTTRKEKYPGTDRYAPCPCNSGKKYKFCCGMKGR